MESSNKLLDVGETEHAGAKMNNYEEKMIPDRTDRLDAEIKFTGLIFMCNKQTMEDCFTYSLFGLPFNRWRLVKQIVLAQRSFSSSMRKGNCGAFMRQLHMANSILNLLLISIPRAHFQHRCKSK